MIIVLEGTECVGKTTLANEIIRLQPTLLSEVRDVRRFRRGKIPDWTNDVDDYSQDVSFAHYLNPDDYLWVMDRWHLGEMIYSAEFSRNTRMDHNRVADIDFQISMHRKTIRAICSSSPEVITRRYHERGDEPLSLAKTLSVNERYLAFFRRQQSGWRFIDTERSPEINARALILQAEIS